MDDCPLTPVTGTSGSGGRGTSWTRGLQGPGALPAPKPGPDHGRHSNHQAEVAPRAGVVREAGTARRPGQPEGAGGPGMVRAGWGAPTAVSTGPQGPQGSDARQHVHTRLLRFLLCDLGQVANPLWADLQVGEPAAWTSWLAMHSTDGLRGDLSPATRGHHDVGPGRDLEAARSGVRGDTAVSRGRAGPPGVPPREEAPSPDTGCWGASRGAGTQPLSRAKSGGRALSPESPRPPQPAGGAGRPPAAAAHARQPAHGFAVGFLPPDLGYFGAHFYILMHVFMEIFMAHM